MSILDTKALKGIVCGLLIIAGISIVCAGAGNGDTAVTAKEDVQPKVGASIESSSIYIADYFPEFEKIKIDPAYKYLLSVEEVNNLVNCREPGQ